MPRNERGTDPLEPPEPPAPGPEDPGLAVPGVTDLAMTSTPLLTPLPAPLPAPLLAPPATPLPASAPPDRAQDIAPAIGAEIAGAEPRGASLRRLWVLMATVFVDMIGFAMVLPLLPFYLKNLHAQDWLVGLVISSFAFAQLAASPFIGRLSDRYGRRPMILGGLLLSAVAYVIFGFAHALWLFFLSRFVQGIGSGTTGVVQAYVSDSIEPADRAKALGWVTAATSAGVMVGPLIGSFAFQFGRSAPGYFAAGLCVANLISAGRWLPESRRREGAASGGEGTAAGLAANGSVAASAGTGAVPSMAATSAAPGRPPARRSLRRAVWEVLRQPTSPVGSLIWVYAIGMMAFMALNGVLGLYLRQQFGVTEGTIGWFYGYVGGISVVMRALLLGPAVRRLGEVGVMRLGTVLLSLGMLATPLPALLSPQLAFVVPGTSWTVPLRMLALALVVLLVPVGTALLFPSTTALVSRCAPRGETGQVMGVQQAFGGVSRLVGPIWSTALFGLDVRYPFWLAALLMMGGGFLTTRLRHHAPRR
jgi:multidrug resistance protein